MSYQTGPQAVYLKTTTPTVTDDASKGYFTGCRWVDTSAKAVWVLMDNTIGAADWQITSLSYLFVQAAPAATWRAPAVATCGHS